MARITTEDCTKQVPNPFELILIASHRARQISNQSPITVDRDNDQNTVVALRELGEATISPEDIKEDLIHSMQKHVEVDEPESEEVPLLTSDTRSQITKPDNRDQDRVVDPLRKKSYSVGLKHSQNRNLCLTINTNAKSAYRQVQSVFPDSRKITNLIAGSNRPHQ